jgi:hypothetical protein
MGDKVKLYIITYPQKSVTILISFLIIQFILYVSMVKNKTAHICDISLNRGTIHDALEEGCGKREKS